MKKIVLVTWKGGGNFGTCLQCYALYTKLQNLNYDASLLQEIPARFTWKTRIKGWLNCIGLLGVIEGLRQPPLILQDRKRIDFQDKVYHELRLFSKDQENQLLKHTDCFVTGSDQIWNTHFSFRPFYFLDFAADRKRVAYASSIGTSSIKDEYKSDVRGLLMKFSHIGVREDEAVKVLSELTGRTDIRQVLDPTFLLTPQEWTDMSKDAVFEVTMPDRYILCYLIGNNNWYAQQLNDVREKTKIDNVIVVPAVENPNFNPTNATVYRDASPVEFVYLLQHASFVCTDSFHATALSINHSKPFVEFMRFKDSDIKSQNSRIYDVLTHYHLMDRIYRADSDEWLQDIDYSEVQEILTKDRSSSLSYLTEAIEN